MNSMSEEQVPLLALDVTLVRARAGMNDFIIEVRPHGTQYAQMTPIRFRASRDVSKLEGAVRLAKILIKKLSAKDKDFKWANRNPEYIGKMLFPQMKTFASNNNVYRLQFTTDAVK